MGKTKSKNFTNADYVLRASEPEAPTESAETAGTETQTVTGTLEPTGFTFEDVAIPKRSGKKTSLQYPIGELEAGSTKSFLVPTVAEKVKNVLSSIRTFAYRNDFKVILRQEATGVRVWRKA